MKGRNSIRVLAGTLAMLLSSGAFMVPGNMVVAAETVAVEEVPVPEEAVEVTEAVEVPEVVEAAEVEAAEPVAVELVPVEAEEVFDIGETEPEVVEIVPEEVTETEEEVTEIDGEEIIESVDPMLADNFSFESARVITPNTTASDTPPSTSNSYFYRFTLSDPGYISINFKHAYINDNYDWYLNLYTDLDKSKTLREWDLHGKNENFTTQKIGLPKGTYYVMVTPRYGSSNVQYYLKVNYTKSSVWETERNDSWETANKIVTGKTYHGSSRGYNDQDYYKFTINKDGRVDIQFKHTYIDSSSTYWYMYLYREDSKDQYYLERGYVGTYDSWSKTGGIGLKAGTYYVKIVANSYADTADYSLYVGYTASDVWEKEFNDTMPVATPIKTGMTYNGMIKDYSDKDFYKFTLGSAANVSVRFKHKYRDTSSYCWVLKMWDDRDKTKSLGYWYMKGSETSSKTGAIYLKAGTYYVSVENDYTTYSKDVDYSIYVTPSYGNWEKSNGKWWYRYNNGSYPRNKWEKIDGKWYHFDSNGYMQTGWKKIGGKYYYLGTDGIMRTGWTKVKGYWYYMDKNGVMQTGWTKVGGKWYYMNSSGVMQTGWKQISKKWYYFDKNGVMQTGWLKQGGYWYYLNADGTMVVNTKKTIGGKTYRFNKSGVCTNP